MRTNNESRRAMRVERMWSPSLILFLSVSIYGDQSNFQRVQPFPLPGTNYTLVRFNNQRCGDNVDFNQSFIFCEGSGWGNNEASVVCRNELYSNYGFASFANVEAHDREVGFSYVKCTGDEKGLDECVVGNLTSHTCSQSGILQCFNDSRVVVRNVFNHVQVSEDETVDFCVIMWIPQALSVLVQTTYSGLALAGYDYYPLRQTIIFEATDRIRSMQCLQIEIIDDSLAESWEMFTVLLSTNNSAVQLTHHSFDVFIRPNDDVCTEGSVTVVSDVNNSSLQLVEMCSSEGVWSPVCDYDWTLQDATVLCRQLGYQDIENIHYGNLNRNTSTDTIIDCEGNETVLSDCITSTSGATSCQYVLVQCQVEQDPDDNSGDNMGSDSGRNDGVGIIAGVVVAILFVLVLVATLVVVVAKWKKKQIVVNGQPQTNGMPLRREGKVQFDNPVYDTSQVFVSPQANQTTLEHNLVNPLYSLSKNNTQPHTYAVLERPEYALLEHPTAKTETDTCKASELPVVGSPEYAFVDNI